MTPPLFAFYALSTTCLLFGRTADMTAPKLSSSSSFTSVSIGENVTLECFYDEGKEVVFYWYKQTPGQNPQLVSKFYRHDKHGRLHGDFVNNPRLKLLTTTSQNHLMITDVQISDTATYYCLSGYSHIFAFMEGTFIHVKGSGLNIPALVHQSASETIQPGGSVTLNCTVHTGTCDGEHSVYWFKHSEESHPGLIYTHGGRNDQCERKPNTQTHTCVYNLSMKSLNLSHAGTYYCAVASCGHILFGNGTRLDFEDDEDSLVLVYVLSGALAFTTILIILLAYTAYTTKTCQCTDSHERYSASSAPNAECYQDAENLHYAALRTNKINRSARQRDDTECVYARVRQ